MNRCFRLPTLCLLALLIAAIAASGARAQQVSPEFAQKLYDEVSPSLVGVQFTWEYEFGKADFVQPGVVVSEDGLVLVVAGEIIPRAPVDQLKEFKVIIPRLDKDDEELEAEFIAKDARTELVLVRVKEKRAWKPVKFEELPVKVGETVLSVGMLPKEAGYRPYLSEGVVGAHSRGEVPVIVVTGGALANVGAPVFNTSGKAVGWVTYYQGQQFMLHTTLGGRRGPQEIDPMQPLVSPPRLFIATKEFNLSLKDPPPVGQRQKLPWLGLPNLTGLNKDVAAVYGLEDQPAIEIGDVVPNSPAEQAGLKVGMKIVKMNGQPLTRGDQPEELPSILQRQIIKMPIGEKVTFTTMTEKGEPTKDISVTLGERPMDQSYAERYFAEDLGFGVRSLVFDDTYARRQPADMKGVLVTVIKPNSAAASAQLAREDVITQFNNQPVTDIKQFEKDYKAFREEKPKEAIVLVVQKRDLTTHTIRIEPPQ